MEKELSIKQKAAAEFMVSNPELGYDEVAAKLGINPATLWRWRKREDFQQYSHELCMERFKDLERLAIRKLHENVTKNNQKAICITFILFILTALIYKLLLQNWYTFAALFITGISLSYLILKSLKHDAKPMYLPLVPAFSVAALYFLFF